MTEINASNITLLYYYNVWLFVKESCQNCKSDFFTFCILFSSYHKPVQAVEQA